MLIALDISIVEIQRRLGHRKPDTTLRISAHEWNYSAARRSQVPDDLDPVALEERVEGAGELRVTIVDQEAHLPAAVVELHEEVARLLQHPHAVSGLLVIATCSTRRLPIERKASTYRRRSQTVSTVKKSQARIDLPCARRKLRQTASRVAALAANRPG